MVQAQIEIGREANPHRVRDSLASATASCPIRPSGSFFPVPSFAERSPPVLMKLNNGTVVNTQTLWNIRRTELIELFRATMHGRWPTSLPSTGRPTTMSFYTATPVTVAVTASGKPTIAAKRKNTTISYTGPGGTRTIRVVEYIPTITTGAKAAFLLINHKSANEISLTSLTAVKEYPEYFPVYEILARNYAAVSFMASDVDKDTTSDDPDSATTVSWRDGVHGAFPETRGSASWGTIGAWAWGASRVMDYLVGDPDIDDLRVAVIGHSRSGKAALWAGAQDTRFKLVISNESGTGGHAFSCGNSGRGCNGQQNQDLNDRYPSWFSTKYKTFNADPCGLLPVDAHMLIALSAPRAVYIGTTSQDDTDDNVGAFVAGQGAGQGTSTDPASNPWKLYGKSGFKLTQVPAGGTAAYWDRNGYVGYHRRRGAHGLTIQDWKHYIDFAAVRM